MIFKMDDNVRDSIIREYRDSFLDKVCNLYDIDIPDLINRDPADLLSKAFTCGMSALIKYKDGYVIGEANYVGDLLPDGRLSKVSVTLENGEIITVPVSECAVFAWNNLKGFKGGTCMTDRYAELLTDIDISYRYNIFYSRVCPIPIVDNDVDERSIKKIIDNIYNGVLSVFKRTSYRDKFGAAERDNTMNLTQPETSNYISNLTATHEDIITRVCRELGISLDTKDKKAQVNNKEVGGFADYACFCGKSHTRQLELFVKDCKNNLGIDVTVTPSMFIYTEQDIVDEFAAENNAESPADVSDQEGDSNNE